MQETHKSEVELPLLMPCWLAGCSAGGLACWTLRNLI